MNWGHKSAQELLGESQPEGTVFVFLDECYEPFVAACAVVVESNDLSRLDRNLAATFERVQSWYQLGGLRSFETFRERGFHATDDPYEVRAEFVAFLAEALNFKSLIVFSDRSLRSDLSDKKRLMVVFDQLARDVLGAYRSRPKVIFYFESAQSMDEYLKRMVDRAFRSSERRKLEIEIHFGTKRQPLMLALPDYVLHIFNKWIATQTDEEFTLNPSEHESRSLKAILGSISMARSLDRGRVVRRTLG